MELFPNDQSASSLMDSVYLPDSPYIPFIIQGNPEELNDEICVPTYNYQQESIPPSAHWSSETFKFFSKVKSEDTKWKKMKQNNVNCQTIAQSKVRYLQNSFLLKVSIFIRLINSYHCAHYK